MASINEKMLEARLKWFGHAKRKYIDIQVWRCKRLAIDSSGVTEINLRQENLYD